jgi:hypothetical protein
MLRRLVECLGGGDGERTAAAAPPTSPTALRFCFFLSATFCEALRLPLEGFCIAFQESRAALLRSL